MFARVRRFTPAHAAGRSAEHAVALERGARARAALAVRSCGVQARLEGLQLALQAAQAQQVAQAQPGHQAAGRSPGGG